MNIKVSNTLTIENPTNEIKAWCRKNLTIANPEYGKKARMHLWLGDTPKTIALYEIRGDTFVLPFGVLSSLPDDVKKNASFESEFRTIERVKYNANVNLYDYQKIAVDAMIEAKYGILQSPAGSGKTQMGIALATKLERKTLWLCHTLDLIKQSKERAEMYIDKKLLGTITEGKVNIGSGITFATIQTMSKLNLDNYKHEWDLIITDEVHRVAGSPTSITQYQKVLNSLSARHKYGLSATVHRSDGMIKATYALVGEIAYKVPDELVADKIMKVGILPVGTGIEISREALNTDGTLNYTKLIGYLTKNEDRQRVIVNALLENEGHSCLILSDRLEHLEDLIARLPTVTQMDAVMISGKMTSKKGKAEREQAIEDMRSGKKKYLFATYSLAKEGLDIPRLERLFLTTPQKDYAVITQSIGRIARTFEGKAAPIAYDFVDDIGYLVKSYKKRCTTYRKNGCYFVEGG
ncbi:DEAD/DEAH box helicase [Criibacterium bergeronii]|uniref:ATP-dependent helicase n=1 Tax=Criibacterium bergeronii TaxID=1871336 RepID=A0A1C0AG92_9FIRM|nr:DEAD/DEAH box helicase family protein [Criibacterium bergeronii]RDY21403.1 ATP-dependent helicase [Criibacterium bergeronii]